MNSIQRVSLLQSLKPPEATAPTPFFQLFPGSNGIGEILFLVVLAPVYLIARLIKYLFFEKHTPDLPHEWKERFGEALAFAERDLANGLDLDELACYHSLLDYVLESVPEEASHHPLITAQLEEFQEIQESVSRRLHISYNRAEAGLQRSEAILQLIMDNLYLLFAQGSSDIDPSDAQVAQLVQAEAERRERSDKVSFTEFEKQAIPIITNNIVPALFALPEKEIIELKEGFSTSDPALFTIFFPNLALYLWLKGELKLEPLANVSPTAIHYVADEKKTELALLVWVRVKENSASLPKATSIFSPKLAQVDIDSLLMRFGTDLLGKMKKPIDQTKAESLSKKIEKARESGKTEDKISLWNEVKGHYENPNMCNPTLLYLLIETDPLLKASLQKQNALDLLRSYSTKICGQNAAINPELIRQLEHTTLYTLIDNCLTGKVSYLPVVGQMLGPEYIKLISQAIAHAKMVTELQDKSKSELNRFIKAIDQAAGNFHQANPHFISLVQEILKNFKFDAQIDAVANLLKKNSNPSQAELDALCKTNPENRNKLLLLGWIALFKEDKNIAEERVEPLVEALCDVDFAEEKKIHDLLTLPKKELAWFAIDQKLEPIAKLCNVDFNEPKNLALLIALANTTLTEDFETKFTEEMKKLKEVFKTNANPQIPALQELLGGIGLTDGVENRRRLFQLVDKR